MNRVSRVTVLVSLAAALAVLAAACGGGGSSSSTTTTAAAEPASQWADGVCSAMVTWTTSLKSAAGQLSSGNISKDSIQSAGNDMKSATSTFVNDIKALGPPNTTSGTQAKKDVDQLADELSADVDTMKSAIDNISSGTGIASAVATVSTTAQKMGTQAQTTFNSLQQLDAKGELKSAFQNAPSCKTLSSSAK